MAREVTVGVRLEVGVTVVAPVGTADELALDEVAAVVGGVVVTPVGGIDITVAVTV